MAGILYLDNDNVLRGTGLYVLSLTTGLPVYLDGTVAAEITLLDTQGIPLAGQTWPEPFTYIAGSQGEFLAVLRDTLEVVANQQVIAHISFENGIDQLGDWRGILYVQERTF